jgi:hypothetical protein
VPSLAFSVFNGRISDGHRASKSTRRLAQPFLFRKRGGDLRFWIARIISGEGQIRSSLRSDQHNDIVVLMIPRFVNQIGHSDQVLPSGLHFVSLREFRDVFAFNRKRLWLFDGLKAACCARIFIGGSYVTSKPDPGDYDACWDPVGVGADLEPVLYDENMLLERRERYRGDLLIGGCDPGPSGQWFRYLSKDKTTGEERGMVGIKLRLLEIMNS